MKAVDLSIEPTQADLVAFRNQRALALRLVALSRLMRTHDDPILKQAATTPMRDAMGVATLAVLRSAMLRIAVSVGGACPGLVSTNPGLQVRSGEERKTRTERRGL